MYAVDVKKIAQSRDQQYHRNDGGEPEAVGEGARVVDHVAQEELIARYPTTAEETKPAANMSASERPIPSDTAWVSCNEPAPR